MSLEAMAAGAVPILSESFGADEYAIDNENSFIIKEINNADKYIEKIEYLLNNEDVLENMSKKAQERSLEFDLSKNIQKYIEYFRKVKIQKVNLTEEEKEASKKWNVKEEDLFANKVISVNPVSKKKRIYYKILKLFPKSLKTKVKNFLAKLIAG